MFKTTAHSTAHLTTQCLTVTTEHLAELLDCGKVTARSIGEKANAKIKIGRRTLWNVEKIKAYLNN